MSDNKTIAERLAELPPRTVEGDQGRYTGHSPQEAIAVDQYERGKVAANSRSKMAGVLRAMNFRLRSPGGRAD